MPEVKTEKPLRGETLRYTYPCMWSESAACDLAFCDLNDGRTAVRCIDRSTHRQTQVVMVLELLATRVCREFGIEPEQLVWVMGIGGGGCGSTDLAHHRVTFVVDETAGRFCRPVWHDVTPVELATFSFDTTATHDTGQPDATAGMNPPCFTH